MVILKAFVKLAAGAGPWAAAAGSVAVVCLWVSVDQIAARPPGGTVVKLNRASVRWAAPNMSVDLPSDTDRPVQNPWRGNGWSYDLPATLAPIPGSAVYSAIESIAAVLDGLEAPPHRPALAFDLPLPLPGEPANTTPDAARPPDSKQSSADPAQLPAEPVRFDSLGSPQFGSGPGASPGQAFIPPAKMPPVVLMPLIVPVQPWAVIVPFPIAAGDLPGAVPEPSGLAVLASLAIPLAAWRTSRFGKSRWWRGRRQPAA